MFDHVKVYMVDAIIYAAILTFALGLASLPPGAMLYLGLQGQWNGERLTPPLIALLIGYGLLWLLFFAGFLWAWEKTAFFSIETNGEWVGRNPYYLVKWRIAPDQPRQLKGTFEKSLNDSNNDWKHFCTVTIIQNSVPIATLTYMSDPLPDGNPDMCIRLGYPPDAFRLTGSMGELFTSPHTWNISRPVFLAN